MAQLSRTSGTTVATVKYYLREGLLHPGQRTSATQSQYDESHVRRLGLIRALIDVGGLSVARTAEVIAAMDDPEMPLNHLLSASQRSLPAASADTAGPVERERALAQVDELILAHGWSVSIDNPGRHLAADVLGTFAALGRTDRALLDAWASAAQVAAEGDLEAIARDRDRSSMVETVVVGTVLGDVMLMALRRIAQESISTKHYPTPPPPPFVDDCQRVSP